MNVFVTGITGTLGTALARLHHSRGDEVTGCARGEAGAQRWLAANCDMPGSLLVCDAARLGERNSEAGRHLRRCGRLYHCAAMKHVDLCEANPGEAVRQNADLAALVAGVCREAGVPMVLAGTDKACLPQGVYGATKLIAERAAVRAGGAAIRLANIAGSSGSVLERWRDSVRQSGRFLVTDPDMSRFFMTAEQAAAFMADHAAPGRVAAPAGLRAVRMGDLAAALSRLAGCEFVVSGPRPGETRHQWLVAPGERCERQGGRWLLGAGQPTTYGVHSGDAPEWDPEELLYAAGVL